MASRDTFPDTSFLASSLSSGNKASKGRLYGDGAWSPSDNNNDDDYLQIDLLYEFVICAVATQGNPTADHWTTKYKLQLSYCGSNWVIYKENNVDKVGLINPIRYYEIKNKSCLFVSLFFGISSFSLEITFLYSCCKFGE